MSNQELYELTNPQKNIYMREQFYKGTSINNLSFTFHIRKNLDEKICVHVLNKIIEKNEGLRLRIKTSESEIFQYVEDFVYEEFPIKLYKNKSFEDISEEISTDSQIPFIFENSKLYKFVIYKLKDDETAIYVKLHHIISDAWTGKIFFKQFNEYYTAFSSKFLWTSKNESLESSADFFQYKQPSYLKFLENEKKYFESSKFEKDKVFWEKYVDNLPEAITFKEICSKKTSRSKRYTGSISFSDAINKYCKENNITPYIFFIISYAIYLFKTQSKTDFTIGTPLLNRKNRTEKDTAGMFVSTIPLKIHIDNNDNIENLAKRISTEIFSIFRHESYPYTEILNYAHTKSNSNTNLFDTIISFQNVRPDMENVDYEFNILWNFPGHQQTSFEMHITDHDGIDVYDLSLDYNENFCDDDEIELVFTRLLNIMKQLIITKDKDSNITTVKDISLLDSVEKNLVLNVFNFDTKYEPDKPLITLFDEQVKKHPNNVAIKFRDSQLTYSELDDKINIFANSLKDAGISGNIPVCILLERSLDMVISMLGVLRLGAYYVTIDPFWPDDRINYIIDNIKGDYVITHEKYAKKYTDFKCIFVEDINYSKNVDAINVDIKMSDYTYVIYTSGSTGKPKGTMMTNINVNNLLHSAYQNFKQSEKDIWTLFHTYTFDFSAWEIYGCLANGGKLIIVPKETTLDPAEMLKLVTKEKVTILNQTPAYFYKVLDAEKQSNLKITNLRLVILGGEAVSAEPLKYWKEKYPNITIYNGYGPTETTIFAVMGEITLKDIENNNIYIGYPLENYHISIINKFGEPLGVGLEGEICITSKSVCSGYFNNEEMTKSRFIPTENGTLYKTGDVGFWTLDGRIKYIGRNDNQVKIRGFRIELEEIEKELLKCEGVSKAIVFPIENSNYTKSLVGFIETKINNYTNTVLEQIRKNLTSYMIPKLYQVSYMPINDNGKVDRRKLLEGIKNKEKETVIVKPRTNLEQEIYDIICSDKNISDISVKDDFFQDIGLDSLDIMKLATSLSKYNVEIQKINNNSSIEKLANSISSNKKDAEFINKLYDISIQDKKFKFNVSNILLTGSTGFLGSHILRELILNNSVKNIYCLVRAKGNSTPHNRIKNTLSNYFSDFNENWLNKITIISGDFEKEFLGLDKNEYFELTNSINTIIHAGANVKHFGNYKAFYQANVIGTENIIKFAYDSKAKLAHISTISVGGYSNIHNPKILTEKDINVDQKFNNHVYMITKYEAECKVLDAINKGWISAKIFRMGNIMPRYNDGGFQKNKYDNGFLARMQTIIDTKSIPSNFANIKFDLSPVDLCASCIVKLLMISTSHTILHVYNKNSIRIKQIFKGMKINEVSREEEIEKIQANGNPYDAHLLNDLLNTDFFETPAIQKYTIPEFFKAGFRWNRINKKYIDKLFKLLNEKETNEKE